MSTWEVAVGELVGVFRDSLVALVPQMDRARIPWREPDAYDEWDEIAQAIFRNVVARAVSWSVAEADRGGVTFSEYDLLKEDYSQLSTVEVLVGGKPIGVFNALRTRTSPFDTVECVTIGSDARRAGVSQVRWAEASFRVRLRVGRETRMLERLAVEL